MNEKIIKFLHLHYGSTAVESLLPLNGGASSRRYYRFINEGNSFVLTYSENTEENRTFLYFTEHFSGFLNHLPKVYKVSEDQTIYVQSDLGDQSLLDVVLNQSEASEIYYHKSIVQLVNMQILGDKDLDYKRCFSYPEFNHILVLRDLFSFKNYFLNLSGIKFNQGKLISDFERFAYDFEQIPYKYFVYRDFQTRNIMIHQNEPYFIDYQGGLKGPIQYDLVSLLWQAKTELPSNLKEDFYKVYLDEYAKVSGLIVDEKQFRKAYDLCVLERLLQVLGTYGLRGIYEGKKHFVDSIEFGLKNLENIHSYSLLDAYPELKRMIYALTEKTTFQHIKQIIDERQIKH